jgi:hypothetical protein
MTKEFLIRYFTDNPKAEYRANEIILYDVEVTDKDTIAFRTIDEGQRKLHKGTKTTFSIDLLMKNFETHKNNIEVNTKAGEYTNPYRREFPMEGKILEDIERYKREKIADNLSMV